MESRTRISINCRHSRRHFRHEMTETIPILCVVAFSILKIKFGTIADNADEK